MNKIVIASVIALFATGCSGAPSKGAAQQAATKLFNNSLGGEGTTIENFAINGCTKVDGADGYACDTSGTVNLRTMGHSAQIPLNGRFRYSKASGDWVAHAM